jgi:hypothetical protein
MREGGDPVLDERWDTWIPAFERVKKSASPHLSWPGALTMQGLPGSPMKPRINQSGRFTVL